MITYDNNGKVINVLSTSNSSDKTVIVNQSSFGGTRTVIDRSTGQVSVENWLGDSPFGR